MAAPSLQGHPPNYFTPPLTTDASSAGRLMVKGSCVRRSNGERSRPASQSAGRGRRMETGSPSRSKIRNRSGTGLECFGVPHVRLGARAPEPD